MDKGEIVLYQPDDTISLEVRIEDETVWLNRQQMATLFGRDVKTIGKHINNALKEELENFSVVANFATTARDGKTYKVDYYNLDMILSVGYRVKSQKGIEFRKWASAVLKDYILRGYAINRRIEQLENKVEEHHHCVFKTEFHLLVSVSCSPNPSDSQSAVCERHFVNIGHICHCGSQSFKADRIIVILLLV